MTRERRTLCQINGNRGSGKTQALLHAAVDRGMAAPDSYIVYVCAFDSLRSLIDRATAIAGMNVGRVLQSELQLVNGSRIVFFLQSRFHSRPIGRGRETDMVLVDDVEANGFTLADAEEIFPMTPVFWVSRTVNTEAVKNGRVDERTGQQLSLW